MSAATGVPDFDRAEWRQTPLARDVLALPEFGVLRQSFRGGSGNSDRLMSGFPA